MPARRATRTELPSGTLLEVFEPAGASVWTRFVGRRRADRALALSRALREQARIRAQTTPPMPPGESLSITMGPRPHREPEEW